MLTPSERIFQLLAEKHIDQKDLAKYLGLSAQTMTDWKNGKSHSYHKYLQEISVFLETSMDYLSTGKKEPAPMRVSDSDTKPDWLIKFEELSPGAQKEVIAFIEFKRGQE